MSITIKSTPTSEKVVIRHHYKPASQPGAVVNHLIQVTVFSDATTVNLEINTLETLTAIMQTMPPQEFEQLVRAAWHRVAIEAENYHAGEEYGNT